MSPRCDRLVPRLALAGAVIGALVLSGCGRKSGLDLPPSASVADTPAAAQPAQAAQPAPDEWGPDNKPVAPIGTNKSTPLDWLID